MARQNLSDKPIAVLIDAENAQLTALPRVFEKCREFGRVALRRAYGDFTLPTLKDWPKAMEDFAIQPMQHFRIINGKSASDAALIVDAMDLLHSNRFDVFCIVSSDSDFTRLAIRIREEGLLVYGFGEYKAHDAFAGACNEYIRLRISNSVASDQGVKPSEEQEKVDEETKVQSVSRMIKKIKSEKGRVLLSVLGKRLKEELSVREVKDYLGKKLMNFLQAYPAVFEVESINNVPHVKLR